MYFAFTTNILEWGSEEIVLPYRSPIDNKVHRYYPDFYIKVRESTGKIKRYLNKYNFSRVKLVGYEEEYDYVIMTNRVNWKSLNDLKKSETCFQTFNGKVVSQVIRNGLVLSAIKEKQ